jgi:hypothetical protein
LKKSAGWNEFLRNYLQVLRLNNQAMSKVPAKLLLAILVAVGSIRAQTPTGSISGVVTDPTGAQMAAALIRITNRDSGLTRNLTTSAEGDYSAAALPSGVYKVTVEAAGFSVLERTATVEAGTTTTVNLTLQIGGVSEEMKVYDAAPLIHYEQHQVGGLVSRAQIENLPLNGRNFLDLAKLEPGVTNPIRGSNNRVFVPVLGAGLSTSPRIGFTRVTVDGGDIAIPGTIGAALQVSQEVVQEFQISTVNFDLATSVTTDGAINIVTRSGGNQYHGSGFYFYRDHNLSAYPGLQRDPSNPDPFFQRQQFGYQIGGPIRRDRAFFFTSYEHNNQRGVLSVQPRTPEFVPLGGIFPSPFVGNQFNIRGDVRLSSNHNAFVRYTHDGNSLFAPALAANNPPLPSGWSRTKNEADQSLAALTSVLSPRLVNDLRISYFFIKTSEIPASAADCPGCLGVGGPRINISGAGVMFGTARRILTPGHRYQVTESLVWHKRDHRLRFGFDWEHSNFSAEVVDQEPAAIELYSPSDTRTLNPAIHLPSSFLTLDDILQLPLKSFSTSVGPGLAAIERGFHTYRVMDLYRLYVADTWRTGPRLTVNYGLAWSYEPNSLNTDLTKPKLLTAILGPNGLSPPHAQTANFAPTIGFAWMPTRDGKTVIRGGAGRYFDPVSFNSANIGIERIALSPVGTGRRNTPGSAIFYQSDILHFSGILNFPRIPTTFTAANLLTILPDIRAHLLSQLNPNNHDFTFRNIDLDKTDQNLSDPLYETPYALHFSLGVQRELARDMVLSADFVWRRFLHTFIPAIDYNRFNSTHGPVIPLCPQGQKNDLTLGCSNGAVTFDNTSGIAVYKGLLVRIEKRFSSRTQLLVSYALSSYKGSNGATGLGTGFNNDDWFENYGSLPTDLRHILNLSGFVDLPARFQVSLSTSAYSRPPFSVYVNGMDFNGDGTQNDLLPGTRVNQFNRGPGKDDLVRLVEFYNQAFAGRMFGGKTAPHLTLPSHYAFNDGFFTQDLRLSRTFSLDRERIRFVLLGEVFNLFNIANLVQYDGNIQNSATFGQPGARFSQIFGSGGPRAFQFGARISF